MKYFLRLRFKKIGPWAKKNVIAAIVAFVHLFIFISPMGNYLEKLSLDLFYSIRGEAEPPRDVLIVALDDASYKALGIRFDQMLPRDIHASLVSRLAQFGAKGVFLDFLFDYADLDPTNDNLLADALKLIPCFLGKYSFKHAQLDSSGQSVLVEESMMPLEKFAVNAKKIVPVDLAVDSDGKVRSPFIEIINGRKNIPLGEMIESNNSHPMYGNRDFIYFYGPPGTIQSIPYYKVLQDNFENTDVFKNKLVFVGRQISLDLPTKNKDTFITPTSKNGMYGVEIHATIAANMQQQFWLKRQSPGVEGMCLSLFAFIFAILIVSFSPLNSVVIILNLILLWSVVSYQLFKIGYFVPGVSLMFVVLPLVFLINVLYFYFSINRSFKDLESAFGLE
ncbi:MAG: CHASE2 domain-containing protein [Proteobacteria bacterium]|nr:CHASE2 domain-containing protein [Pseudomonadota bacterium]